MYASGRGQPLGAARLRLAPHGQHLQELQLVDQLGADEGDARLQRGHADGAQPARLLLRGHRRLAGGREFNECRFYNAYCFIYAAELVFYINLGLKLILEHYNIQKIIQCLWCRRNYIFYKSSPLLTDQPNILYI